MYGKGWCLNVRRVKLDQKKAPVNQRKKPLREKNRKEKEKESKKKFEPATGKKKQSGQLPLKLQKKKLRINRWGGGEGKTKFVGGGEKEIIC